MKIAIAILILLVGILLNIIYLQDKQIEICDKIHYLDSLTVAKQDSIIRLLTEKDTVK